MARGEGGTYDFVFIDADKEQYDIYYELSLKLLKRNGLMVLDNTLFWGGVVDSKNIEPSLRDRIGETALRALRDLNSKIHSDDRLDMVLLPLVDGITLVRKR